MVYNSFNNTTDTSNSSTIITDQESEVNYLVQLVIVGLFVTIAIIGNTLIIIIKIKPPRTRSLSCRISFPDTLSILLAICDLVKAIVFMIINVEKAHFSSSHLFKVLLVAFSLSNFLTILLTSLRCRAICNPLQGSRSTNIHKIVLLVILGIHALVFVDDDLLSLPDFNLVCFHHETNSQIPQHSSKLLSVEVIIVSMSVILSVVAMSVFLCRMFHALYTNTAENLSTQLKDRRNQNRRTLKILLSIYIAYMTSFVPWVALFLIGGFKASIYCIIVHHPLNIVLQGFIAGSFCNTFLTNLRYSTEFRRDLSRLFRCQWRTTLVTRSQKTNIITHASSTFLGESRDKETVDKIYTISS